MMMLLQSSFTKVVNYTIFTRDTGWLGARFYTKIRKVSVTLASYSAAQFVNDSTVIWGKRAHPSLALDSQLYIENQVQIFQIIVHSRGCSGNFIQVASKQVRLTCMLGLTPGLSCCLRSAIKQIRVSNRPIASFRPFVSLHKHLIIHTEQE